MSFDGSQLAYLAADLRGAESKAKPELVRVASKAALNIKNQLVKEARGSRHFGQISRAIDYDIDSTGSVIEAEIGTNKARDRSAALAGIAYFGSSRPGGGTLPDPRKALEVEAPKFEKAVGDVVGKVFE